MKILQERMTLVCDDANDVFGDCSPIDEDYSLHALVRAIVMKYGDGNVNSYREKTTVERVRVRSSSEITSALKNSSSAIKIIECVSCFAEEFTAPKNWSGEFVFKGKPFPVDRYLSQFAKTKVFSDAKNKRLALLVDRRANHVWVQALESLIFCLMPWYFPSGIPKEDEVFFRSFSYDNKEEGENSPEEWLVRYVNEAAKLVDFKEMRLLRLLDGVADRTRRAQIESLRSNIDCKRSQIRDYLSALEDLYVGLDNSILQLSGLESLPKESDDAMIRFFKNHKQISLISVENSRLTFGVEDTLEFYDEDEFKRICSRGTSFVNAYSQSFVNAIKAIFLERKGVFRVSAAFYLNDFKLVRAIREYRLADKTTMPNPHIYFYGCSGGNDKYYTQYAESGDWDLGIEQAIAATKNLNWGDSTVCQRMLSWINDNKTLPCIYYNGGEVVEGDMNKMSLISFDQFCKNLEKKEK